MQATRHAARGVTHSKRYFGNFNRFAIYFHELSDDETKRLTGCFGMWFVADAERIDELTGLPAIVAQEYTEAAALKVIYDRYPHAFADPEFGQPYTRVQ